jgi:hypothetical protein
MVKIKKSYLIKMVMVIALLHDDNESIKMSKLDYHWPDSIIMIPKIIKACLRNVLIPKIIKAFLGIIRNNL